jgi:hypothetical protein
MFSYWLRYVGVPLLLLLLLLNLGNSVNEVTGYVLDDRDSALETGNIYFLHCCIQIRPDTHSFSCPVFTGVTFPMDKTAGVWSQQYASLKN